jgi:hypothetical protein
MRYDTTKHNLNWNSFSDAKSHITRHAKLDESGHGKMKIMHNTNAEIMPSNFLNRGKVTVTLHWTEIYQIEQRHDRIIPSSPMRNPLREEFPHSVITLNSGGYRTVTTKDRMNRFLPLGYRVVQRNYNWILQVLETPDGHLIDETRWCDQELFYDGMQIEIE